jgi:nucleotide-binding universal stress UspA family protein
MRIKTILCPVDRSDVSVRALSYAALLAREYVARLSVLEVIDWGLPPRGGVPISLPEMPPDVQDEVLGYLNRLVAPAQDAGVATELAVEVGPIVRRILDRADTIASDLIVVGTHGRTGFDRLALGSVAEKVLRKAARPVLAVPPGPSQAIDARPFRSIVSAVDLSPATDAVIDVAADLATRYGSELVVLNVVEWPFSTSDERAGGWKRSLETRAEEKLAGLVADHCGARIKASHQVVTGTPADEILALARARASDLIVLGVSGHGAVERAILGATAHGVVRRSQCPVLTVPV